MESTKSAEVTRRDLLRGGAAGFGLAALAGVAPSLRAKSPAGGNNIYVVIELRGGNDGLNTVVPIGLSTYAARRGALAMNANQLLSMHTGPSPVDSHRLHPSLQNVHGMWARGELAVIHKVGFSNATLSHFRNLDMWSEGVASFARQGIPRSGWVARYADQYAPTSFGAVRIGNGRPAAILGGQTPLQQISGLSNYALRGDPQYFWNHQHRLNTVQAMLNTAAPPLAGGPRQALQEMHAMLPRVQAAVATYPGSSSYPTTDLGQALSDVAVLIYGNFGTRIFFTGFDGFDTHARQGLTSGRQATPLSEFDAALGAFAADMRAQGLWNRIVVAVTSDFGRRNYPNASKGTDHGGANVMMLLGGGVRGGLYGKPETDADLALESLPHAVDFRQVHAEVLRNHMGVVDPTTVFPEPWDSDPVGGFV